MLHQLQPALFHRAFRTLSKEHVLIDLRSQWLFVKGSLPGAVSFPQQNYAGTDELVLAIKTQWPSCAVYAFDENGMLYDSLHTDLIEVHCLEGGYAAYLSWQEQVLSNGPAIIILGGHAGAGKTELLQQLTMHDEQVLDLEQLAMHKGSVFGNLNGASQPVNAEFHASIVDVWLSFNSDQPVWIEEEGPFLGTAALPAILYERMLNAPMLALLTDFETRLAHIIREYGAPSTQFVAAIRKLEPRMGMSANHKAIHHYESGNVKACFELLLRYYDGAYTERRLRYRKGPLHELKPAIGSELSVHALIEWSRNV